MRHLMLILPVVFLTLLLANPVLSADYQKGLDAYDNQDFATALREWEPLANQGVAKAQNRMGLLYEYGKGVTRDNSVAAQWYDRAAAQGLAIAQINLGNLFGQGRGVTKNYKIAFKLYQLAAEQGHVEGQYLLALMYFTARGTLEDPARGHMWYGFAALQGHEMAKKMQYIAEGWMSPTQIETAQRLARECLQKNYRGC